MIHLDRRFAGRRLVGVAAAAALWSVSPAWVASSGLEARAHARETSRRHRRWRARCTRSPLQRRWNVPDLRHDTDAHRVRRRLEYHVDIDTPRGIVAGRPFRLRLTVRHPRSRAVVQDFAVVHEKRFHMFVIGEDLTHYDHVHPEQQADGSWAIDVTLPRSGRYRLYSDFLPTGGTPQVNNQPLVTSDVEAGETAAAEGRLVPDRLLNHVVGDLSVTLELPAGGLLAGREERFLYRLADARTGKPVDDVEPYLGAWGHSMAVSENMSRMVHAHPVELVPDGQPAARAGPTLTFKAALPEAGTYRIWTQIKRRGEIATAVFTVRAEPEPRGGVSSQGRVDLRHSR